MTDRSGATRLVLVRHGHPEAYNLGIIPGLKSDTGLSELGRSQVAALAARLDRTDELGEEPVLVSSVLPRAIETAAAIAPVFDHPEWDQHCDLCEVHPGDELDGMSFTEFQERFGEGYRGSVYEPWGPGSESWAEFVARTGRRLLSLVHEHEGRTIVVACHGGIIDASFRVLGHVPMGRRMSGQPAYTSITEWVSSSADDDWLLARYNDHAHLEGLPGPTA
ncbi:MAG TPA: histidine phosphatase family protein [Acidimicrobiales bacterium]|nr:histidine phosphatase family protein [Acidimicrobiales bacterium]